MRGNLEAPLGMEAIRQLFDVFKFSPVNVTLLNVAPFVPRSTETYTTERERERTCFLSFRSS